MNNLQHFQLYLFCQNNHFEVGLLCTPTFKPIPYTHRIKNNTQQKLNKQQPHKKYPFPLLEKENLTDKINLSGPLLNDSKYTINQVFNLHDQLDTVPLIKDRSRKHFSTKIEKNYTNLEPGIRQLKPWHTYKTESTKADTTILENKTLLRYFRKLDNTSKSKHRYFRISNTGF